MVFCNMNELYWQLTITTLTAMNINIYVLPTLLLTGPDSVPRSSFLYS